MAPSSVRCDPQAASSFLLSGSKAREQAQSVFSKDVEPEKLIHHTAIDHLDLIGADASDHVRGSVIAIWIGGVRIGQTIGPVGVTLALGVWSTGSVLVAAGIGLFGITVIATGVRTLVPGSGREINRPR